ncbi:MAG: zinc ribbon domain-containing protein [Candidatus Thermoplasmatota archaeon]
MTCQKCGAANQDGSAVCSACGSRMDAGVRYCVSCGRSVDFNVNVCPYCGHDYRVAPSPPAKESLSGGMRVLLYLVSVFVWIAGIIIGIVFMMKDDPEYKRVGKICLILGIVSILISVGLAAALYVMVLGFGTSGGNQIGPTATLSRSTGLDGVTFTFVAITESVAWGDMSFLLNDGYESIFWHPATVDMVGGLWESEYYDAETLSSISVSMTATDLAGDGQVQGGDFFLLSPSPEFNAATAYTLTVIWNPSGEAICSSTFSG